MIHGSLFLRTIVPALALWPALFVRADHTAPSAKDKIVPPSAEYLAGVDAVTSPHHGTHGTHKTHT